MPQTPTPTDSTSRRVDAMLAVRKDTDRDRDLVRTPAGTTVRPPRPRRVVAFMSAVSACRRARTSVVRGSPSAGLYRRGQAGPFRLLT